MCIVRRPEGECVPIDQPQISQDLGVEVVTGREGHWLWGEPHKELGSGRWDACLDMEQVEEVFDAQGGRESYGGSGTLAS